MLLCCVAMSVCACVCCESSNLGLQRSKRCEVSHPNHHVYIHVTMNTALYMNTVPTLLVSHQHVVKRGLCVVLLPVGIYDFAASLEQFNRHCL